MEFDTSYTQNRELSWLRFNERVLEEAADPAVPLWERLQFVSIFTTNLDEFFMVRVGSLTDMTLSRQQRRDNKSGMTPAEQLHRVFRAVGPLYKRRDRICAELEGRLRRYDIANLCYKELTGQEKKHLEAYFATELLPLLSPQVVDRLHPFPHLANKSLQIAVPLRLGEKTAFGLLPVPDTLPRLIPLSGGAGRYILLEQLLLGRIADAFPRYTVVGGAVLSVTRNADCSPEDEAFDVEDDYRSQMKRVLKKRARLAPVRLEMQGELPAALLGQLCQKLHLGREQVYKSKAPLSFTYLPALFARLPEHLQRSLRYPVFHPCPVLPPGASPLREVQKRDLLLQYPYQSMDSFLHLVREAACDPSVLSVKITIYRLARKARLVEYLEMAAENHKDVTVLLELRARFDEANNINWSENLEQAGCRVLYGLEHYKVHAKVCLITRRERGRISHITYIGTGNFNERTAALYTDLALLTADPVIGADAAAFFNNMALSNLDGQYRALLVAPFSLRSGLLALIEEQAQLARSGGEGRILLKMNALTDRVLIDALAAASRAGVQIDLIVRGICCLLPGVPGQTENIRVRSIVGRFLEHSRIYCFGSGESMRLYLSSADLMTRNTERRVEIACPVRDPAVRAQISQLLQTLLQDNVKARQLCADGSYAPVEQKAEPLDSQRFGMRQALQAAAQLPLLPPPGRLRRLLPTLFGRKR